MPGIVRKPGFWLGTFILWSAVLYWLSSTVPPLPDGPKVPHFDKVAHFGYFFGGGGLLAAFFFRLRPDSPPWGRIIAATAVILSVIGMLDEWHQTFTEGRSGNDPGDWLADTLGALVGALVFRRLHWLIR